MEGSKLTSEDFNVFLKHWMTGGCSKLELLLVFVQESINFESVFNGVEFIERGDDVERVYFVEETRTPHTIRGGFDVKRSNVTATVVVSPGHHFCMIVCIHPMTTPFRLFSLPYVPLKQVLDNLGPHGIIILSLCSQRSKSVAVSYRGPSKNVRLTLDFGLGDSLENSNESKTNVLLRVEETGKLPMDEILETVRIGSFEKVPVKIVQGIMGREHLITYWEDRMTGVAAIGDYGRKIFNQDIHEVWIGEKQAEDDHRRAAEWVKNSQETIQILHCDFKPKIDNDLDFILENFNYTEKMSLNVNPSPNYCPAKPPKFSVDFLYIILSFWIKQDHLLSMDCKYIALEDSTLCSRDLNVFIKHWMTGGCSKLKDFTADIEKAVDYEVVLDGVDFVERGRDVERIYVDETNSHHTMRGGFDFKRPSDNAKVTIINGGENWKFFWMIVWPDFAGNSYED
ncbi:hypothetical protein GCK72_003297 [Caenorhabditis remanei]|uniref:F-box domain-containing protein n=1 Tax=Caenorhabditis remanei TaxID=31234 RepID=A0A6A5HW48_CAERE|nr:hypothetical protein GCK72_003297 [Caenorhabditis remanei]KAF1771471.1 hypothetical protein GCK72_003297 [Caenorhabditis remanei]